MSTWDSIKITDEELLELFPDQCFPEIEEIALHIGEKALHITGEDAEWALQPDAALAVGPGRMSFLYSGELRFQIEGPEGARMLSMAEAKVAGLPTPEELQIIERGQPWEFVFSLSGKRKMRIFAEVTGICWTPDE